MRQALRHMDKCFQKARFFVFGLIGIKGVTGSLGSVSEVIVT